MYSILYFVVTLCVVNASVVVVNVFDEPDQTNNKGVSNCKDSACYLLCSNLGYSSDACSSKYCKCENYEDPQDGPESPLLENDLEDTFSRETCNNQECDQRCRRMKFPGGVCVNGRCKCDNFLTSRDDLLNIQLDTESEDISAPQSCNMQECDQRCRRLKFPGGVCVNGRCKCDNFLRSDDVPLDSQNEDNNEVLTPNSCNYQECNQRCKRLKFPGGACVNGRCKCDNFLNSEDDVTNSQQFSLEPLGSVEGLKCNAKLNEFCDRLCRILKYNNGTCVDGACKCFKKELDVSNEIPNKSQDDQYPEESPIMQEDSDDSAEPIMSQLSEADLYDHEIESRSCNGYRCNNTCKALRFVRGVCRSGKCYCSKK